MDSTEVVCRVCGFEDGSVNWQDGGGSFEFCSCCGVQHGYGDGVLPAIKRSRAVWEASGYQWFKPKLKPEGWSVAEQFRAVPSRYL